MLRLITTEACRETVAVLRWLLGQAIKGHIRGMALCSWTDGGKREVLLTGVYHKQPEHAFSAADLIKVKAGHQLDLFA